MYYTCNVKMGKYNCYKIKYIQKLFSYIFFQIIKIDINIKENTLLARVHVPCTWTKPSYRLIVNDSIL